MKRIMYCWCLIVGVILVTSNGYSQKKEDIDQLSKFLDEEKYVQLVNEVSSMREKAYYKNVFMDYCLAYGYCKLNKPQASRMWFDHILKSYNTIDAEKEAELTELRDQCSASGQEPGNVNSMVEFIAALNNDGFEGNTAGIESKMGIPSMTDKVVEIDYEHATFDVVNRQFTQSQKSEAWTYFQSVLEDQSITYQCDSTKHLLYIHTKSAGDIKNQMLQLENYYQYYNAKYGLGDNDRLITIFYVSNRNELNKSSLNLHNVKVPNSIFGYASSADLTLTGIARSTWLGALKHELFHLMIRSYIGDTPPWLDEGVACLFESSHLKTDGNISYNMNNYRTNLLQHFGHVKAETNELVSLPTVKELVQFSWMDFSGRPGDLMIQASVNYSVSYIFSKYLLDKGKLETVLNAYQNRTYTQKEELNDAPGQSLVIMKIKTVEQLFFESLGLEFDAIQLDFEEWCKSSLSFNPYDQ